MRQLAGWEINEAKQQTKVHAAYKLEVLSRLHRAVFSGDTQAYRSTQMRKEYLYYVEDDVVQKNHRPYEAKVEFLEYLRDNRESLALARGLAVDSLDLGSMRADGQRNYRLFLKVIHRLMADEGSHSLLGGILRLSDVSGLAPTSVARFCKLACELGHLSIIKPKRSGHCQRITSLIEVSKGQVEAVKDQQHLLTLPEPNQKVLDRNVEARKKHIQAKEDWLKARGLASNASRKQEWKDFMELRADMNAPAPLPVPASVQGKTPSWMNKASSEEVAAFLDEKAKNYERDREQREIKAMPILEAIRL